MHIGGKSFPMTMIMPTKTIHFMEKVHGPKCIIFFPNIHVPILLLGSSLQPGPTWSWGMCVLVCVGEREREYAPKNKTQQKNPTNQWPKKLTIFGHQWVPQAQTWLLHQNHLISHHYLLSHHFNCRPGGKISASWWHVNHVWMFNDKVPSSKSHTKFQLMRGNINKFK